MRLSAIFLLTFTFYYCVRWVQQRREDFLEGELISFVEKPVRVTQSAARPVTYQKKIGDSQREALSDEVTQESYAVVEPAEEVFDDYAASDPSRSPAVVEYAAESEGSSNQDEELENFVTNIDPVNGEGMLQEYYQERDRYIEEIAKLKQEQDQLAQASADDPADEVIVAERDSDMADLEQTMEKLQEAYAERVEGIFGEHFSAITSIKQDFPLSQAMEYVEAPGSSIE